MAVRAPQTPGECRIERRRREPRRRGGWGVGRGRGGMDSPPLREPSGSATALLMSPALCCVFGYAGCRLIGLMCPSLLPLNIANQTNNDDHFYKNDDHIYSHYSQSTLCFKKKFTLLLFAITKSDVDRFQ